ncbi:MAG: hypothetical protein VXY27_05380, partial [Thermoproteota archaeon]|nr:hypothetical protein [Thermoproteota archaeon]
PPPLDPGPPWSDGSAGTFSNFFATEYHGAFLFYIVFSMPFCIDFGSFFGGPKPEKYQFPLRKTMIFTKSTFSLQIQKSIKKPSIVDLQNQ